MPATFGLIDGNAFCSCERAFAPRLRGRAVVVLSNNDGCAIARTAEAKAAGIKMGDPWHLARKRPAVRAARVDWFSSNYALYGDMSRCMYEVLAERVPRVEPYSIDEMFLDLDVPGDVLREEFMAPLGLSARALARDLGVPANRITEILNGERSITAETAILLARRFGSSAEFWMNLQTSHDLEVAREAMGRAAA